LGNCPVDEPAKTDGWVDRVQSGQAAHDPQLDVVWVNTSGMRGRTGHDLLLSIIMVMECGWDIEMVINLSK